MSKLARKREGEKERRDVSLYAMHALDDLVHIR